MTPWGDEESWKRDKVFTDIAKWSYSQLSGNEASKAQQTWADLHGWHKAHPLSDTLVVGQPVKVSESLELPTSLMPWGEMWKVLKSYVAPAPLVPNAQSILDAQLAPAQTNPKKRGHIDRQQLGATYFSLRSVLD